MPPLYKYLLSLKHIRAILAKKIKAIFSVWVLGVSHAYVVAITFVAGRTSEYGCNQKPIKVNLYPITISKT